MCSGHDLECGCCPGACATRVPQQRLQCAKICVQLARFALGPVSPLQASVTLQNRISEMPSAMTAAPDKSTGKFIAKRVRAFFRGKLVASKWVSWSRQVKNWCERPQGVVGKSWSAAWLCPRIEDWHEADGVAHHHASRSARPRCGREKL